MSSEYINSEYGLLNKNLDCDKLSNLCVDKQGVQTGPFGSQLHQKDYVPEGTPIITVEHLGDNRITTQNMPFVSDADRERLAKYSLKDGDIVFSRVGSVDRRALVRGNEDGWLFSGRCLRVRVNRDIIDPTYLSYFFGLEGFKKYIRSIAVGATMPSINTKILSEIPIYYPSLNTQKEIAKILTSIDDKLELNNRINQTLELTARAIFKSWFVDFDPVKAKAEAIEKGEDPELAAMQVISGKNLNEVLNLPKTKQEELKGIALQFPSSFEKSELGEIPLGWNVKTFKQVIKKYVDNRGKTPPVESSGIPLLEVKHLPQTGMLPNLNTEKYVSQETYETWFRAHVESGDTLISTVGTVGRLCFVSDNVIFTIAQNILGLRFDTEFVSPLYMYQLMKGHRFTHDVDARLVITVQKSIKRKDLNTIEILQPPIQLQKKYESYITPLIHHQQKLENQSLISLRDTLLPKLLSGELTLPTAEAQIEEATA